MKNIFGFEQSLLASLLAFVSFTCVTPAYGETVRIEVRDQFGQKLQGVAVQGSWQRGVLAYTDNDGEAKIRNAPESRVTFQFSKPGFAPVSLNRDLNDRRQRRIEVRLQKAQAPAQRGRIEIHVRDTTGRPVPFPNLTASWLQSQVPFKGDRNGVVRIQAPTPGTKHRLSVWANGYRAKSQEFNFPVRRSTTRYPVTLIRAVKPAPTIPVFPSNLRVPSKTISRRTGLPIYGIPLRGGDSRASDNFDNVNGFDYLVRATLQNVRQSDLRTVRMKIRGDRKNRKDADRSGSFGHGQTFWIRGRGATKQRGNFVGRIEFPRVGTTEGTDIFNQLNPNAILVLEVLRKQ